MCLCIGQREGESTRHKEESRSWLQDTSLLCFISKCLNQPPEVYTGFPGGKGQEKECTWIKGCTYEENERCLCILLFSCPSSLVIAWRNGRTVLAQHFGTEGLWEQRQWVPPENPAWVDDKRDLSSALRLGKFPVLSWHGVGTSQEGSPRNDWGWISGLPCGKGESKPKLI